MHTKQPATLAIPQVLDPLSKGGDGLPKELVAVAVRGHERADRLGNGRLVVLLELLGQEQRLVGLGARVRRVSLAEALRVEHAERDRAPLDALELLLAQGHLEHLLPAPRHLLQQRKRRRARVEWQLEDARVDLP